MKRTQIDAGSIFREAVRMCTFDHYLADDVSRGTNGLRRDEMVAVARDSGPPTVLLVRKNDNVPGL